MKCTGACQQGRKACDCFGDPDRDEAPMPMTVDDAVCAVIFVGVVGMLAWGAPVARWIEELVR